jgi:hypothetical protein
MWGPLRRSDQKISVRWKEPEVEHEGKMEEGRAGLWLGVGPTSI